MHVAIQRTAQYAYYDIHASTALACQAASTYKVHENMRTEQLNRPKSQAGTRKLMHAVVTA